MSEKIKRRRGDRRDARWVREVTGLQTVMTNLLPNRTDCEVYLSDTFDATELVKFLETKNTEHPEYKTTVFHAFLVCLARMVKERPLMNRYISGRRTYERYDITLSFVAKRRFADGADEALMTITARDEDTLDSISHHIAGDLTRMRKSEHSAGGIDSAVDAFAKLPRVLIIPVFRIIRWLDFWGLMPKALTEGDPNYCTVLASNLGSIQAPAVYHHLNNYGTNSIMVTLGTLRQEERLMPDGTRQMRDVIDVGATLDERIGDGFYFARSLKLVKYIFEHPELLDRPLDEASGFEYK